jgi:predicted nucleic acid-binding protein
MNSANAPEFKVVISDTTCLILLHKLDAFEVLRNIYPQTITTPEVLREFGEGLPSWITIQSVKNSSLVDLFRESVDQGEASAIALAIELTNCLLIVDDRKARKLANQMNIEFIGTLGMLVEAKNKGAIAQVRPYLDKIQKTNFRVSQDIVDYVLELAKE